MKIAVAYDNGMIFQHFGRTETFKVYTVEDGAVVSSEILSTEGQGHGALARLLTSWDVNVLICGGIGPGAQSALQESGIKLFSGIEGTADTAVNAYLRGVLESADATCDHHCGDEGDDHECCEQKPQSNAIAGPNVGKQCRVHYRGTFNDGTQFDSSYDRGQTLDFICGAGGMIRGFDAAVAKMVPGEIVEIHLMPEDAYGYPDPNAFITVNISEVPGAEKLEVGQRVYLYTAEGQPIPVTVSSVDASTVTFDTNHEMAGKELNFKIELVEVK